MARSFLSLPREDRADILAKGASELNKTAQVLELHSDSKCLRGKIVLVPPEPTFGRLKADFAAMAGSGMFVGDEPKFAKIIDRIERLQNQINTAMTLPKVG